jgi:uncharacterized protein (DUF488 family)
MPAFDLFSIGHSNIAAARFTTMLHDAGVNVVADVRSTPVSRFCPWFSAKNLAPLLARENMIYLPYGEALGGRPRDAALYRDGVADYDAMARTTQFRDGLERLLGDAERHRVCLMWAEREPLDCHRCLLVTRALTERGAAVGHILHDGTIEPHTTTEERLLRLDGDESDLFATGQDRRIAAAYRRRTRAVAYRVKAKGAQKGPQVCGKIR